MSKREHKGRARQDRGGEHANATVYAPLHLMPGAEHLAPFAPGATIEEEPEALRVVLSWPGLRVVLTRMDDGDMGEHLAGLQGFVRQGGGGEALAIRVLTTLSVYGFVIEPGFDEEGRAMNLVAGLTSATEGLCFLDGQLHDGEGTALLGPDAGAAPTPAPERVAARALVLLALAHRGLLEDDAGKPDEAEGEAARGRLAAWVDAEKALTEELEESENELLHTPLGEADPQAIVDAVWGAEGAAVLLWALGARALPPHDVSEHPFAIGKEAGLLGEKHPALIRTAKLRKVDELWHQQRRLLAIHWRLVEQRVSPGAVDFLGVAKKDFLRGVDLDGIPVVGKDLAVGGKSLAKADPSEIGTTASIATERHRAANWLVGVHPVYSTVVAPT